MMSAAADTAYTLLREHMGESTLLRGFAHNELAYLILRGTFEYSQSKDI